ncbi:ribosomal-protein-alanine N-acetyltransferase [Corallincola luteus]|uniref:[Ribosomal protein bS18]-alanine N-acetyltransferase n=2 Tax=Corallincola TaxID=1775176 RepID=A0A368N129_9GAMM|nr:MULTISPECIES: ribosomal protein S18-alanine N-acetyltransferase [Corallincola]RCU43221.1 ribosomal-protein-alanine N-acetyltransferase [Corallincola holothuriorum]TCI02840.1 ribosomal-protein-alanine N-acetyltransferase [Corallincola luteus]
MSQIAIELRELVAADIAAVMHIEQRSHSHPAAESNILPSLTGADISIAAVNDGQVIGFYIASQVLDEVTLTDIAVLPEFQGQGIGRRLLVDMLTRAEAAGGKHLFLEVRASNMAAQALYRSEGFNELGVRHGYYPGADGREDAVIMGTSLAL